MLSNWMTHQVNHPRVAWVWFLAVYIAQGFAWALVSSPATSTQQWLNKQEPRTMQEHKEVLLKSCQEYMTWLKFMGLTQPVAGYPQMVQKDEIQGLDICRHCFFLKLATGWNTKAWPWWFHKFLSSILALPVDRIHGTTAKDHLDRIHKTFWCWGLPS